MADEETKEQMRKAIENTALAVTGVMKVKKKADLYSRKILEKPDVDTTPVEETRKLITNPSIRTYYLTFLSKS